MSKSTDKTGKTAVTKAVTKDVNMDLSIGTRVDVRGGTHDGKTGTIKKVSCSTVIHRKGRLKQFQ